MQGARRRCRWCCRKSGSEPHDFPFSNEEIRHLCEAVCLISTASSATNAIALPPKRLKSLGAARCASSTVICKMSVADNGTELTSNAAKRERTVAKGNCTRGINLAQSATRSAKAWPHRGFGLIHSRSTRLRKRTSSDPLAKQRVDISPLSF